MQWRGGHNTMGKASYIDFSSRAGYEYWKSHVKSQLLDKGCLVWLNNNELTLPDDSFVFACEVLPDKYVNLFPSETSSVSGPSIIASQYTTQLKEIGTVLLTLLMAQSSYEAMLEHETTLSPFLISRSAVPYCNQLVSQTWCGDNTTAWKTIQYNVSMELGASLCSMPAGYGHGIRGFAGPKPDPEMFVQWVQQGVF